MDPFCESPVVSGFDKSVVISSRFSSVSRSIDRMSLRAVFLLELRAKTRATSRDEMTIENAL
jgi:hypothetical protein